MDFLPIVPVSDSNLECAKVIPLVLGGVRLDGGDEDSPLNVSSGFARHVWSTAREMAGGCETCGQSRVHAMSDTNMR